MGVGQAAKYLGISRNKIYRLINKKILTTMKCEEKQATLIPLHELTNYRKAGSCETGKGAERDHVRITG